MNFLQENTCRVSETDYSDAEFETVAAIPYEVGLLFMGGK
jgi:hypothetical protein